MASVAIETPATTTDTAAYRAVELIYHSYLTGLILMLVTRAGAAPAAEVVFRTFRRQQLARFLPGLKKLGLDQLPHAVACAQYHYLSNQVGGVKVEYVYENDRKAWVRYPPPRWIWSGTAICGITSEVSRAMLRGWHDNNGVVMGNPSLRRGSPQPRGLKNGCARSCAIMRWNTLLRFCRKRSRYWVLRWAAISPARRRGSWACRPSTRSPRCWEAWNQAPSVSPPPSPD